MTVIAFLFETHSNTVVVVDWFVVGLSTCRNFFALRLIMMVYMFWLILLMVFVRLSCNEKVFARKFVYQAFAFYE